MAHFSNGSERHGFQHQFCARCASDKGNGCAINLIYDLFDCGPLPPDNDTTQPILDCLITETRDANQCKNFACSMFQERATIECEEETGDSLVDKLLGPGVTAERFLGGTLLTRNKAKA